MKMFDIINEATGFANGEPFTCEEQVREYFTISNIQEMFWTQDPETLPTQEQLDEWAELVIANR